MILVQNGGVITKSHLSTQSLTRVVFALIFLLLATASIAQPANDEPADAIALTLGVSITGVTVSGATNSGLNLCYTAEFEENDDIFYTFVAPVSGAVDIELANPSGPSGQAFPAFSVLNGTVGSLACEDDSFGSTSGSFTGLTGGTTYFLQIFSLGTGTSTATFDVLVKETPSPPSNDECANATALTVGSALSGTIEAATNSGLDPCTSTVANDDVWYSFVATGTNHSVYVDRTSGTNPGLRLGVHSGSCGALVNVSCNTTGGESLHLTGLTIGAQYYIQVYSNTGLGTHSTGFNIEVVSPPSNDDCSAATSLSANTTFTQTYRGATPTPGATCLRGGIWYEITGTGGRINLSASPTANNDVALAIYTGSCGSLTEYICEDAGEEGGSESISFISLADDTYYVYVGETGYAVGGYQGDNEGDVELDVSFNAVPGVPIASGCNTATSINMTGSNEWLPIILGSAVVGKIKDTEALGTTTISLYGRTGALRVAGSPLANRNITITPTIQPSLTIAVRLYFTASEIDALIAADENVSSIADLQFTKVSGSSCSAAYPGGGIQQTTSASGSFGSNYYIQTSVASFSEFFLSSSSAPLPVDLASFTASAKTGVTQVEWKTASEQNVDYFSVERSADGSSFDKIGEVVAIGESTTLQTYDFVDDAPLRKAYYRLVSVDLDGSTSLSDVVYVEQVTAEAISVNVFPNPVSDVLNVEGGADAIVQLIDPTGRTVMEQANEGDLIQFQTSALPKGIYFVRIISGASSLTKQVVLK